MMRSDTLILLGVVAAGAAVSILYTMRDRRLKSAGTAHFGLERTPKERLSMAQDLVAQAEINLKGYSFLGGLGIKYDTAAELLESAGNNFKMAKSCKGPLASAARLASTNCSVSRLIGTCDRVDI